MLEKRAETAISRNGVFLLINGVFDGWRLEVELELGLRARGKAKRAVGLE